MVRYLARIKARDVLLALVCVGFVVGAVLATWGWGRVSNLEATARSDHTTVSDANSAVRALASQVRNLGGTPVVTPKTITGPPGPGPSNAEIALAVANYCAQHENCTGTPSPSQVFAAVKAYCSAGAVCRGSKGSPGPRGPRGTGAPGAVGPSGASGAPGAPGPGPTDQQIASAVAAYCDAHGGCTGPAGPKGDTGVGISSIDCEGPSADSFVIHYTDGTEETVQCSPHLPVPAPTT